MKLGDKVFYKNEPVLYFDSLKTSTLEGAATTVYAQGGRGNARLIAWEGERTVTFTMEDALISPMGFSVLTGAGLVTANENEPIIMHRTETTDKVVKETNYIEITLSETPYIKEGSTTVASTSYVKVGENDVFDENTVYYINTGGSTYTPFYDKNSENPNTASSLENQEDFDEEKNRLYIKTTTYSYNPNDKEDFIYVMLLDENGDIVSEPYIASEARTSDTSDSKVIRIYADDSNQSDVSTARVNDISKFTTSCTVLVDYYVSETSNNVYQIDITPSEFGGNFYLEASTLFRDTNGTDLPAEFIIPNCKIQSNFTFTMASSGDPSTFTFTMDAFPDYTRWNKKKKVFAAIQVLDKGKAGQEFERLATAHNYDSAAATYDANQKPFIELD